MQDITTSSVVKLIGLPIAFGNQDHNHGKRRDSERCDQEMASNDKSFESTRR